MSVRARIKKFRTTCLWALAIVLVAAGSGVGYLYHLASQANPMVKEKVVAWFDEVGLTPACRVVVGHCGFRGFSPQIEIRDVSLTPPGHSARAVSIPRTILTVDSEQVAEMQVPEVRQVHLVRPRLDFVRGADGRWNWQDIPVPHSVKKSTPEFIVEDGTLTFQLQQTHGGRPLNVTLNEVNLQLVPRGKRQYDFHGDCVVAGGPTAIQLRGSWDVDKNSWKLDAGSLKGLLVDQGLIELAADISPAVRSQLVSIHDALRRRGAAQSSDVSTDAGGGGWGGVTILPPPGPTNSRLARVSSGRATSVLTPTPDFGLRTVVDVSFRVAREDPLEAVDYQVLFTLHDGEFDNAVLPFPLRDLAGQIYVDRGKVVVKNVSASSGSLRVKASGRQSRDATSPDGRLQLNLTDLTLDSRLRNCLSGGLGRMYDQVRPQGLVDVEATLYIGKDGSFAHRDLVATAKGCSISHVAFPYPLTDITGTIRQQGNALILDMSGKGGGRLVRGWGRVVDPGPASMVELHARVLRAPIDETFLNALNPDLRKVLESFRLRGSADCDVIFHRPTGLNQEVQTHVTARLSDCRLNYKEFPYRVEDLSGVVTGVISSDPRVGWQFSDLKGVHGAAGLTGYGHWLKQDGTGHLSLDVEQGAVDLELKRALPKHLQDLWDEFSPAGKLDLTTSIDWSRSKPVSVVLKKARLTDGAMELASFPYPLRDITADFQYDQNGVVWIRSFEGFHGYRNATRISAKGFSEVLPSGDWRVHLNELAADDLPVDDALLDALPKDLRSALEYFNPTEPASHSGVVELRGTSNPRDPITASWDVRTVFSGGTVSAGLDLEDIQGTVTARGSYDGHKVVIKGKADLKSVKIWGYQLNDIRGPFHLDDLELQVGSERVFAGARAGEWLTIPDAQQVKAKAIDGTIRLNAIADLSDETRYAVVTRIDRGNLEKFDKLYIHNRRPLRGSIDGWVALQGHGDDANNVKGKGQLQISPAALYDLPVIVEIFERVTFVPRKNDKGAFNKAYAGFDVENGRFIFNQIYLQGDAIDLRGQGSASFDGTLSLDFVSQLSRKQLPVPFLNQVVSELTKSWVGVKVRGTTDDPDAEMKAAPHLDDALKGLLRSIERGATMAPPLRLPPGMVPPSRRPSTSVAPDGFRGGRR